MSLRGTGFQEKLSSLGIFMPFLGGMTIKRFKRVMDYNPLFLIPKFLATKTHNSDDSIWT
jgi:hypothetical protein